MQSGKRSKKSSATKNPNSSTSAQERREALDVLFDFLVSLLTKPQSVLRDIANFTFKQFCTEISQKALANLIDIVQTPNTEASKMLFDEEEIDQEDAEEGEDEDMDEDDDESEDDDSDESD